ncbi:hypothetical protein LF1_06540 [Rubripirellula obstinata]|uniref:Uncharacterized protein n=1 Tax=Rubripirellula obstinata TaxID=406547 RepID=A0A5B1CEF5_9BACT|nr:hypothetical protein LF1_06540 [Rubripirellula obstinata]
MRFETQQADPGSNSQGFFMFLDAADVADKRRVWRHGSCRPSSRSGGAFATGAQRAGLVVT